MQGSHCHVATSPSHDVGVNKCRSQPVITSRRHHVATSSRRDVTTLRRQLKNLHLIIKCERARELRVQKNVRLEIRNFRTCNTDSKEILEVCVAGSKIPYLWPHVLPYPQFPSPLAFNDEMQIFELTSRRGDIAT